MPPRDYTTEAAKLARAIDIAIESFRKYPPKDMNESHVLHFAQIYSEWKDSALNPAPVYRKLSSLKYIAQDIFTYFQEAAGETVEYFWTQVSQEKLDYVREDKLRKIIGRGKIKSRLEFDYVTDTLIAATQEGRISEEEATQFSVMLGDYENRKRK
jgi:hypothetical protein